MIIIGIDPGTTAVGYALLESNAGRCQLLSSGLVHINSAPQSERLKELHSGIKGLVRRWSPGALATERIFFAKNQKTALAVAEARGVILLTAALAGLMVYEYTPLEIKKTVAGYGGADKLQLKKMVRLSVPGAADLEARDDIFDAIAAAFTCHLKDLRTGNPKFLI